MPSGLVLAEVGLRQQRVDMHVAQPGPQKSPTTNVQLVSGGGSPSKSSARFLRHPTILLSDLSMLL